MRIRSRAIMRAALAALIALVVLVCVPSCASRDVARETLPVTNDLGAYWTCAVAFTSDGRGDDANEAFTFVPWLEQRAREKGVFEPLEKDAAKEAEALLRVDAKGDGDRVVLRLLVIDMKTKEELGEVEAVGSPPPVSATAAAPAATDVVETERGRALRAAADRILDFLKEKRRVASATPKKPPPATPPDAPPVSQTTVAGSAVCSTQCLVPAAAHATHGDKYGVSAAVTPMMRALRDCLDRVGGQLVVPAVLLRFGPDGRVRHIRVDVGGYEELECIQNVRARAVVRASTGRATILRCEYRCSTT